MNLMKGLRIILPALECGARMYRMENNGKSSPMRITSRLCSTFFCDDQRRAGSTCLINKIIHGLPYSSAGSPVDLRTKWKPIVAVRSDEPRTAQNENEEQPIKIQFDRWMQQQEKQEARAFFCRYLMANFSRFRLIRSPCSKAGPLGS